MSEEAKEVLRLMLTLTEADRKAVMDNFCHYCGTDNPRCQCWNDE